MLSSKIVKIIALGTLLFSSTVYAEGTAGSITQGLAIRAGRIGGDRQWGGVFLLDVWHPRGPLRIGASTGLVIQFNDADARTIAPLLGSLAIESSGDRFGFSLRTRAGMWAGATNDGLRAGMMLTGGLFLHCHLQRSFSIATGIDVEFLYGHGNSSWFVPSIAFVW